MIDTNNQYDHLPRDRQELRGHAIRRLKARRGFRAHAIAYVTVNVFLWGLWAVSAMSSSSIFPWPIWVTLGWGIGLAFHGWGVFMRKPLTESVIEREIERISGKP